MDLSLTLSLPRDAVSVPLARRVLRSSLEALGVETGVVHDIELVITEACTNVLDHARADDEYEIRVGLQGDLCVIEVLDRGAGFDPSTHTPAAADAETGRGIAIMRDLLDRVSFEVRPTVGSVVRMEKRLELRVGSPLVAVDGA